MNLPAEERIARLRLARAEGVGPVTFRRLLTRFGSGRAALEALPDLGGKPLEPPPIDAALAEIAAATASAARHVFCGEADYPPLLAQLPDPPPVLLMRGNASLARRPVVGIVGARNASAAGRAMAQELARGLAGEGFVVVSGMARGIDAAAHEGALEGGTIACVAGGVDVAYPPENALLQEQVAARGLIVSELPPGTEPQARHFPRRNRLIAGMAEGLLVIEAAQGSGSLITARLAGEAGREVMAVPGHPRDPRARGCNALLKAGATLVEEVADVLAALRPFTLTPGHAASGEATSAPSRPASMPRPAPPVPHDTPEDVRERVAGLLSSVPVPVEDIVRASGMQAADVTALLTEFELEGRLVRHAGGRVATA
ncbi:DNA-processing protein DprA [Thermaurantiacus sp.]